MPAISRTPLEIFGVRLQITHDDELVARLIDALWGPFKATHGDTDISIDVRGTDDHWEVASPATSPTTVTGLWQLMFAVRSRVDEAVLGRVAFPSLHAAAVARGDDCVLVVGPSYAGKTTISLGLVRQGWSYVCDDVALLDEGRVLPFPRPIGVRNVTGAESFRWDPPRGIPRPDGSPFMVPATAFPRWDRPSAPTMILLPERVDRSEGSRLVRLSPSEAVMRCFPHMMKQRSEDLKALADALSVAVCVMGECTRPAELLPHVAAAFRGEGIG